MKANNLSISIPYAVCGKDCPYCISKMTGYMHTIDNSENNLFIKNLQKARRLADSLGIASIMITSKGEPLNNMKIVKLINNYFSDYPIEIQTNGLPLLVEENHDQLKGLANIFCVSADMPDYFQSISQLSQVWNKIRSFDAISRATVIVSNRFKGWKLSNFIVACQHMGIRQLTFRRTTIPDNCVKTKQSKDAQKWIKDHYADAHYKLIVDEIKERVTLKDLIMTLPFGPSVYDIEGISVTFMDYCFQEFSDGENIRSLIYQEDGHMYLTWDKQGSIIW